MRICIDCGREHKRATKRCIACYYKNETPEQTKKRKIREKRHYKKLSDKWKKDRSGLICKRCGKKFNANKSNQKYCSKRCQLDIKTPKPKGISNCVVCGKKFVQKRRDSKACSAKCIRKWEYVKRDKKKKNFYERTRDHKIRANGGSFTYKEWDEMKKEYKFTCPRCKRKEPEILLTIDHIIPISKNGRHIKENIQPLCISCNIIKNNNLIKKYECSN